MGTAVIGRVTVPVRIENQHDLFEVTQGRRKQFPSAYIVRRDPLRNRYEFDTIRLCLIKVAARVTEMVTRIKVALPTAFPYQAGFAGLAGRIATLPP